MSNQTTTFWTAIRNQLKDPLYSSSMYIFAVRILTVAVGFLFWMVAARLYSVEDVGLAVALVSSAAIVNLIATLGFDQSVIRFIKTYDAGKIINSSITIITISSLAIGIGYSLIALLLPSQSLIQDLPLGPIVFIAFCVVTSVAILIGNAFLAMRKQLEYLAQTVIVSSRLLLLLPLAFLGSYGILGSFLLASVVAMAIMLYYLNKSVKLQFQVDRDYVTSSFKYTAGSFLANLFVNIPGLLLPILVLAILGPAPAAIFYVGLTVGNVLQDVPFTLTTALFVEGSHGSSLRKNVVKAFLASYAILIPAFLVFFFFGGYLLMLYGPDYAGALGVLRLMALASFFITIYYIFSTIQKVKMGIDSLMKFNFVLSATIIGVSCLLMKPLGIEGIGLAVAGTYFLMDLVVLVKARREGWI